MKRWKTFAAALLAALLLAPPAHADPISAAIAVFSAIGSTIGAIVSAVSAFTIGGFAVGRVLLSVGVNLIAQQLFAPKRESVRQRQASILELSLGEHPREAIFGRAATGGTLANTWNHGTDNKWECLTIIIADHEIDAIEGFYVDDKYYSLTTQGFQTHADFKDSEGRAEYLYIQWKFGKPGEAQIPHLLAEGTLLANGVRQWETSEAPHLFKGQAVVSLQYKLNDGVWKNGRPTFRWVVRGLKCYDPRLDSTVEGGSGPHRWGQPSTYTWSENARVCHYNYIRGVWNYASDPPQLMVGPGKSAEEAPPEQVIADANLCDELVALKAGGSEKRYRCGGVISAAERWINVEEHFAAAMGGQIVERAGLIGIDPGAAKSVDFEFTDANLLAKVEMSFQERVGRDEIVNTVIARYVSPQHLYEEMSTPMRRSAEDIEADGEPREETIDLALVTSGTQAQRIAEIRRRKHRQQATAIVALGPAYMMAEDADWLGWTSERRFGGERRVFEAQGAEHDNRGNVRLPIKQTASSCFSWNPATDEIDPNAPDYLEPGALPPAEIVDFEAAPLEITSADGISAGAIRATWTPPDDATIVGVRLEYRPTGGAASSYAVGIPEDGAKVIDVLPVTDVDYEVRATPITSPSRPSLTTAWRPVALSAPFNAPQPPLNFVGYQTGDQIRWVWTTFPDTTLRYEIRCGPTFELGRFVDNVAGGATTVTWPIASEDDDLLFWIKTVHRSGVYSEQASLWVAAPNINATNFVLAEDFQAAMFPGVRHDLTDAYVGDLHVLELATDDDGLSHVRGDYYTEVSLSASFSARTWLEQRASAYINDTPPWEGSVDSEETWEDDEEDWLPDIGDAGGDASIDAFIAIDAALPESLIEGFRFNDTLEGVRGLDPSSSSGITYAPAKTANGVVVGGALEYEIDLPMAFSQLFDQRLPAKPAEDLIIVELTDDIGQFLRLKWRAEDELFVLEGNYGAEITFDVPYVEDDTLSVGIWQSGEARGGVVASRLHTTPRTGSALLI